VIELALKLVVMPVGCPLALRFTAPEKPLLGDTEIVKVWLLPVLIDCTLGVAHTEKSGVVGPFTKANMNVP
jgi:hypothetical protein